MYIIRYKRGAGSDNQGQRNHPGQKKKNRDKAITLEKKTPWCKEPPWAKNPPDPGAKNHQGQGTTTGKEPHWAKNHPEQKHGAKNCMSYRVKKSSFVY